MSQPGQVGIGTRLKDRYEIVREIGRGGFSVVYEALDHTSGRPVAVKMLIPPPAVAQVALERLRREVKAVQSLSSPYLVPVYDLLEEDHWTFVVMELVAGSDLHVLVSRKGPLSSDQTIRLGMEIGEILSAAHRRGILHRDVKPQNILVGDDGRARLTDFGSARMEGQATLTHTGAFVGTIEYAAPETQSGERADARADIYSLGLSLYFALTGKLPGRLASHLPVPASEDGHHPAKSAEGTPEWLDHMIARATRADPSRRFPTVAGFVDALRERSLSGPAHVAEASSRCLLCGASDPFGLWICASCLGQSPRTNDTFVILESPDSSGKRKAHAMTLGKLFHLPSSGNRVIEAASGRIPLIKVTRRFADQVVERLRSRNITGRVVASDRVWSLLSREFYLILVVVILAGSAAGWLAYSPFVWITPLFASLLFAGGWFVVQKPLLIPRETNGSLPRDVQSRTIHIMSNLSSHSARTLLADLTAMIQQCHSESGSQPEFRSGLEKLLQSYCSAATNLDSLEKTLSRMETRRIQIGSLPEAWKEGLSHCEQARDMLVQRFLEAIAVVGSSRGLAVLHSQGVSDQLKLLTADLQTELEIQSSVARQMQELIQAQPP